MDTVVTARGFCRTELLQLPERGHAARLYAERHKASQRRAARRPGRKPRRIAARRKQVKNMSVRQRGWPRAIFGSTMRSASIYAAGMLYAGGVTFLSLLVLRYARNGFSNLTCRSTGRKNTFQGPTNFVRFAYRTNSAVAEMLSLRIADERWVSTIFALRFNTAPTDLLVCPSAIN